jgi:hypothetical protein
MDLKVHESLGLLHERECLQTGFGLPPYDEAASLWAFGWIYEICRLYSFRELGREEFSRRLPSFPGNSQDPAVVHSVDLCMRHLPGISRIVEKIAEEDPLLGWIRNEALRWPLSCAGMALEWEVSRVERMMEQPTLRLRLLDRLHAQPDINLESLPPVQQALRLHTPFDSFQAFRTPSTTCTAL